MTPEDVLTFTPRRTLIDEVPVYSCDVPTLPPTIGMCSESVPSMKVLVIVIRDR